MRFDNAIYRTKITPIQNTGILNSFIHLPQIDAVDGKRATALRDVVFLRRVAIAVD